MQFLMDNWIFLGGKWPGREANQSAPPKAEIKNAWCYSFTHRHTFAWNGA
jgi:hypothetical protein